MINYDFLMTKGSFAEVTAGVLGVALSVTAFMVQLASNRYTPKISELFTRNKTNMSILSFYTFTCIYSIWIAVVKKVNVPISHWAILAYLICVTIAFATIVPYFYYVLRFLRPQNIIHRLVDQATYVLQRASRGSQDLAADKDTFFAIVEEIGDIGVNSISSSDRSLGLSCVGALRELMITYFQIKNSLDHRWFKIESENFMGFSKLSIKKIEGDRTWVEMSILKQFEFLLSKSVNTIREMVQEISTATKDIALAAERLQQQESLRLTIIYFNTFLRLGLNAKDQYAIYNLFYQYRTVAEGVMATNPEISLEIAEYFKYYGRLALAARLPFILETAAHDLRILNEFAFQNHFNKINELLNIFLEVDKDPETKFEETALRGVRKSQAILGAFYLMHGRKDLAQRVFEDMRSEPLQRLASIRDEILQVEEERFWEVTDRWINFDYVDQQRKEKLKEFFSWIDTK